MAGKQNVRKPASDSKIPRRSKSNTRQPTRTQSKSPARKSPTRSNPNRPNRASPSPARKSPTRKSPTRKSPTHKSPTRRSPSRTVKSAEKAPRKFIQTFYVDSDSDSPEPIQEVKEKPKIAVRGRTRHVDSDEGVKGFGAESEVRNKYAGVARRSTRSSHSTDVERVVHLNKYDTQAQKLTEFSDEDDVARLKSAEKSVAYKPFTEFGGTLGALSLMFLFPVYVALLHISCNKTQCSFLKPINFESYARLSTYFDLKTVLIYFAYALFLAILTAFPFGGKKVTGLPNKQGKLEYVMNGLFATVVLLTVTVALEFYGIRAADFLSEHYFHFILPSFVFGFIACVYAYVRSFYVPVTALNPNALQKLKIYNFFMGREVNPRFLGIVDLKMYFFRLSLIATVLVNTTYLFKTLRFSINVSKSNGTFDFAIDPTFTILYGQHLIFLFDRLMFESVWLSSFETQYEGFGYMATVGFALYPFIATAPLKYVYESGVKLPYWQLAASFFVFLVGFVVFLWSNWVKDAFRRNPYNPKLKAVESIPTPQGKKLIVSGPWGYLRHPNYLGNILMNLALVPFVYNVPPVTAICCMILFVIHRSVRDGRHCKQRYGASWDRYCQRVKYVLLPKVY